MIRRLSEWKNCPQTYRLFSHRNEQVQREREREREWWIEEYRLEWLENQSGKVIKKRDARSYLTLAVGRRDWSWSCKAIRKV